jgi:hypothetical protein
MQHCNFILGYRVFASNPLKFFPWSLRTNKDQVLYNNHKNDGFIYNSLSLFVSSKINVRVYLLKNNKILTNIEEGLLAVFEII